MPEVQEVFRLATNKVKPDPSALERQHLRQRSSTRSNRVRAYLAVAAVIAVLAVVGLALRNASTDSQPAGSVSPTPDSALPALEPQRMTVVDLSGRVANRRPDLPPGGFAPSLSSDGSTVAWVGAPDGGVGVPNKIQVMPASGGEVTTISTPGLDVRTVAISPDATRVAFEGWSELDDPDIYVVDIDGSGLTRLTTDPATDEFPQWSPDGTTIVYDNAGEHEDPDPQFSTGAEIWAVPAAGGVPTRLTRNGHPDSAPAFSPDGSQIAYFDGAGVSTMQADGSGQRELITVDSGGFTPRWSPDGSKIAYTVFSDVYRPLVMLGSDVKDLPLVTLAVVDVTTGRVTSLGRVGMASDLNTPQWTDRDHLLVLRVSVRP